MEKWRSIVVWEMQPVWREGNMALDLNAPVGSLKEWEWVAKET